MGAGAGVGDMAAVAAGFTVRAWVPTGAGWSDAVNEEVAEPVELAGFPGVTVICAKAGSAMNSRTRDSLFMGDRKIG